MMFLGVSNRRVFIQLAAGGLTVGFSRRAFSRDSPTASGETISDATSDNFRDISLPPTSTLRKVLVRVRVPNTPAPWPLIIYSPGLGAGLEGGAAWCRAWRGAGFAVATISHPGMNDEIWDTSRRSLRLNIHEAIRPVQYQNRIEDLLSTLRLLTTGIEWSEKIDRMRVGIAGHSFGAITVRELVEQQSSGKLGGVKVRAAVLLSPGGRRFARPAPRSKFRGSVLCVTGDGDGHVNFGRGHDAVQLGIPLKIRLDIYEQLSATAKELIVFRPADHMTFSGEAVPVARFDRPQVYRRDQQAVWTRISQATALFWKFYLTEPAASTRADHLRELKSLLTNDDLFRHS